MSSPRCCKRIYGARQPFGGSMCSKPVKVEINGKHYCATHDPDAVARRDKKRDERWEAESEVARQRAAGIAENNRRAARYPGLVAVLEELDAMGGFGQTIHEVIRAALSEATKP